MARVYRGWKGRAVGAGGGLLMLATGLGMYLFMGVTASNVPVPGLLESAIYALFPVLERTDDRMPLLLLLVFGLTSLVLTGMGARLTVEALRKEDYSVRVN